MGTKGPKAGNIFTSLRSRGLVGGQGQDPSIKGMGSPLKQTKDGSDASVFGSVKRAVQGFVKTSGTLGGNYPPAPPSGGVVDKLIKGFGQGNRHMDGPAPTPPNKNSKAVLESEKKGDEAINDKMKAGPKKKNHKY